MRTHHPTKVLEHLVEMDNITSGGIGAGTVVALGLAYKLYLAINHHRIKSTCMGKEFSASIDVDETTPKKELTIRVDGTPNRPNTERDEQKS
jgi:hypothetical protein